MGYQQVVETWAVAVGLTLMLPLLSALAFAWAEAEHHHRQGPAAGLDTYQLLAFAVLQTLLDAVKERTAVAIKPRQEGCPSVAAATEGMKAASLQKGDLAS